jgi:transposase
VACEGSWRRYTGASHWLDETAGGRWAGAARNATPVISSLGRRATELTAREATQIGLLRLPTYVPWTNPIEKLWQRLKQEVLHQHDFR